MILFNNTSFYFFGLENLMRLLAKIIGLIISLLGLLILIRAFSLLRKSKVKARSTTINKLYRKRFMEINLYALLVTVLIIVTSII